jgi:hypothetical protein
VTDRPPAATHDLPLAAEAFSAAAERALSRGEHAQISSPDLARVMTAAVRLYAAKAEDEDLRPAAPVAADVVTPTEVVTVVTEMLRAADVSLFDLAMWYRRPAGGREP